MEGRGDPGKRRDVTRHVSRLASDDQLTMVCGIVLQSSQSSTVTKARKHRRCMIRSHCDNATQEVTNNLVCLYKSQKSEEYANSTSVL